jgi:uracil-DNA glycosylase family 4
MGLFGTTAARGDSTKLVTLPQCGLCGLYKGCHTPKMQPTGRGAHKVLFVGEAPGASDDLEGAQFVDKAGQCLRRMVPVDVDLCWKTNATICRSVDDDVKDLYIDCCRPNIQNTINILKPNVIVLLGMPAIKAVIGPEWGGDLGELTKWVGWAIPSPRYNAWLCPTYPPSHVLRANEDPALVLHTAEHLRRAVALEKVRPAPVSLEALKRKVEIIEDPRLMRLRLKDLATKSGRLVVDYETTGAKPESPAQRIYSASFCLNGTDTFSGLIDELCHGPLRRVLTAPALAKEGQNVKFEQRWSIVKLGVEITPVTWDTMLSAHIADNREGITGLKFMSYINYGVADYSTHTEEFLRAKTSNSLNKIHLMPPRELLLYGGLDALLEYMLGTLQMERAGWT